MTQFTEVDLSVLSDMYKDVYCSRPREGFWAQWNAASEEGKKAIWDDLAASAERAANEELEIEKRCIQSFEDAIKATIAVGAGDRKTALRWMFKEEQDIDYALYSLGLPWRMFDKEVMEACA